MDKEGYCNTRLSLEHKCVHYAGICNERSKFVRKENFDDIECGTGEDGLCTRDACCDAYGAFSKHVHVRAVEMLFRA